MHLPTVSNSSEVFRDTEPHCKDPHPTLGWYRGNLGDSKRREESEGRGVLQHWHDELDLCPKVGSQIRFLSSSMTWSCLCIRKITVISV